MDLPRSWEVAGTREIPDWEREILERLDLQIIMPSRPWERREPITFPKGLDRDE